MPFDRNSGVVYHEAVVGLHSCPDLYRHRLRCISSAVPSQTRGSNTLVDMARRRFARTLTARSTDYIKEVLPEQMAEKLWEWLVRNGAASLSAWKVFAATGYFGSGHTKVLSLSCTRQQCLHFAVLRADMSWLTDLTIGGEGLSGDSLASIPRLCNLRTFHLRLDGRPSREAQALLSDRTLRAWAADASERNALSKLEMIVVDEQTDITISVLQYLNGFPSLGTFATRKCGIDAREEVTRRVIAGESQRVGWRAGPGYVPDLLRCRPIKA